MSGGWTDVGECCAELIACAGAQVLARARAEIREAEQLLAAPRGGRR